MMVCVSVTVQAQTYIPGKIVRPSTNATTRGILDPNGDGFVSATTNGYYGQDDVAASNNEIVYKPVYPFFAEPNSDLRRGPDKRFTDYVPSTIDRASYYMYYTGTNVLFRVRMGSIIPGAKGYSFLIDIDGKFGSTGPLADPNYIAQTTGVGGNPGFEIEVDLFSQASQTGVAVYNIDGKDKRNNFLPAVYSVNNWLDYSQVSMAATSDNGDPDYYVDFYLPFSALSGITFTAPTTPTNITTSTNLRIIPTTVMAPLPAVGGPKSDIYGLPDYLYPNANDEYIAMLGSMPPLSMTNFGSGGSGQHSTACTAPPIINKVSSAASTFTVTGTWTPNNTSSAVLANVVITVYRSTNGGSSYSPFATTATVTATSSTNTVSWSIASVPVASGNLYYAVAQAPGESACFQSSTATATNCATAIAAPILDPTICNNLGAGNTSSKGFTFNNKPSVHPSSFARVANITQGTSATQTSGSITGTSTIQNANSNGFQFFREGATAGGTSYWDFSSGCSGGPGLSAGSYRFWVEDANGCPSGVTVGCVLGNGGNQLLGTGTSLNVPAITSPANGVLTAATTSISVSATQGTTVTFLLNGVSQGTAVSANGGVTTLAVGTSGTATFNFAAGTLTRTDRVQFLSEYTGAGVTTSYCGRSGSETIVSCTAEAPNFNTNSNTGLIQLTSNAVAGTSSAIGGTVNVYNSASPGTVIGTATVGSTGAWTSTLTTSSSPAVTSGQLYVATVTALNGCVSDYATAVKYDNTTTAASHCTGAAISSYTTSYLNGTSYTGSGTSVTNGPPTSSSFAMNAFATTVTVAFANSTNPRLISLYEDGNFVASTRVAANSTTAVFTNGSSTGDNLGFYTGTTGSSSPGNVYFTISDTSTSLQVYLPETTCPNVGVVTCPVSTTTPTLTVANCPTCTATGTSSATVPSGGTITFKLTNVTPNTIYALRSTTGTSYSNTYSVPANFTGNEIYISSFAITGTAASTVTLEAIGTTVIVSNNVTVSCAATSTSATVTLAAATSLGISGTVYDDPYRYNIGGTPVGSVTNALSTTRQLYVYLVNNSNQVVNSATITTSSTNPGIYSFTGLSSGTTYKVVLDTVGGRANGSTLAASTIPYGWAYKAEGTTGGTGDGTPDGIVTLSNLTATKIIDFGINGIPLANSNSATSKVNPGGTTLVTVPSGTFTGSDPRDVNSTGIVEYIRITAFPSNATSITVIGGEKYTDTPSTLSYTSGTFPATGVYIATNTSGSPSNSSAVQVDPVNGTNPVAINYVTVDNGGKESSGAVASQPLSLLNISGTIYNDYTGLTDNLINGTAGNGSQTIYVNAVSGGSVLGTATVAANGTYTIGNLYAASYSLVLTTTNSSMTAALPSNWSNTGEGSGSTSDGTVNGATAVVLSATDVTGINFGYNRISTADAKTFLMGPNTNPAIGHSTTTSTANGANSYAAIITLSGSASSGATPGALTGSDPDGNSGATLTLTQQVSAVSLVIDPSTYAGTRHGSSFSNAIMPRYDGVQLQPGGCAGSDIGNSVCSYYNAATSKWEIPVYDLSKLKLLVRNGTSGFSFSYAWKDAAGSLGSAATYNVSFEQPLPVQLLTFSGDKRSNTAALSWIATNEQSFRGYAVERSEDGRSFGQIGFVNGRGSVSTQSYFYNDDLSALNVPYVYYRLRLEDLNGSHNYSAVVRIALQGKAAQSVQVLGNPVRTTSIRMQLQSDAAARASFVLTDGNGRVVASMETTLPSGNTQLAFPLPAQLANGAYTLLTVIGEERFSQVILLDN